jgi:hypothetical protein
MKSNSSDLEILQYVEKRGSCYTSPTEIGREVGKMGRHSAWASPKCRRLTKYGLLERSKRGWYRITQAGLCELAYLEGELGKND